ncbi:hypothetical protein, partial [Sphaerisporangium aureirubrum]|uniref:hypothetical protein n=1 Tax=Sphaerisporangium aureirubrum TaxID=1544736 RepID=UPI003643493B
CRAARRGPGRGSGPRRRHDRALAAARGRTEQRSGRSGLRGRRLREQRFRRFGWRLRRRFGEWFGGRLVRRARRRRVGLAWLVRRLRARRDAEAYHRGRATRFGRRFGRRLGMAVRRRLLRTFLRLLGRLGWFRRLGRPRLAWLVLRAFLRRRPVRRFGWLGWFGPFRWLGSLRRFRWFGWRPVRRLRGQVGAAAVRWRALGVQ